MGVMLKLGHRGAPREFPENTIASFKRAIELGAAGIELDVHKSKDGEIVVIHDETVNRTTNGSGKVANMTLAELKTLNVKGGGSIPTLSEVLEALDKEVVVFIEIKAQGCEQKVADIVRDFIARGWANEKLWIISFDHALLARVKTYAPELQIGATTEKMPKTLAQYADDIQAGAVLPCIKYLSADFVVDARIRNLKIFVWTANDPKEISKARGFGVDGIMTDELALLS